MENPQKNQWQEKYKQGEIYTFTLKNVFPNYWELIDETTGITTYYKGTAKLRSLKGRPIQCRITKITEKRPYVELVDRGAFEEGFDKLTMEKLETLLTERQWPWNIKSFINLLLTEEYEESFELLCHRWIQDLLNKKIDLRNVRRECSDLLELSNLLNLCVADEREYYQSRMSLLIEQLGYYIKAEELIENEEDENAIETPSSFIDNILKKLSISGFVYHPSKNFNILASLFLRRPYLMHDRIQELLYILKKNSLHIWKKEPFRSALIKLLELYIRECEGKISKTRDNLQLIENNLTALAIQLLLMSDDDTSLADRQLNTARLCTIASYMPKVTPEQLLEIAFDCLFNPEYKMVSYTLDGIKMLPHYISSLYRNQPIPTINNFIQNNIKLSISSDGVVLSQVGSDINRYPVFPSSLNLWRGIQIYLPYKPSVSLASVKANTLKPFQNTWNEIENEFFNNQIQPPVPTISQKKERHKVYDIVRITIRRQDLEDQDKFYCQIEDEIGGMGFIRIEDIVPYPVNISLRHFMAPDGCFYVFEAEITDIEDDQFKFSMLDNVKRRVVESFYDDEEKIICSVGSKPNCHGEAPAISKEGASVTLKNASEIGNIEKNTIVSCSLLGEVTGEFHIQCRIDEVIDPHEFSLSEAFKTLMKKVAVSSIQEPLNDQEDEEQILEPDKVLDESYVRELIYIIDRLSILDKDYIKSYNYLAFARLLSMLIGWEGQASYYKGRMDIIAMLHDFAMLGTVDEDLVKRLAEVNSDLFSGNGPLKDRFMQLQMVSYLERPEHNQDLYNFSVDNSALKSLAELCLAYNITKAEGMRKTAVDIHNRIKQLLNLKGFETDLKQYGSGLEDEYVEYKSSIVFSADRDSKGPDQERQMKEILRVINSFLNTSGGTLYIGVNDAGLGVGVEADLETHLYNGNKDLYKRTIQDEVAKTWGNSVLMSYIQDIDFDPDNKDKDVLWVKVKPYESGIPYDGVWWVRKGGTKRSLSKEKFEHYQRTTRKLNTNETNATKEIPRDDVSNSFEEKQNSGVQSVDIPIVKSNDEKIKTSHIRKNVLTEYWGDFEHYVEPIAYLKFLNGNQFKKLEEYDYEEDTPLTLAVKAEEEKGYLVLGYENGKVVKVPIEELLEFQKRDYPRNSEAKLVFASIASKNDAVLTIFKESKRNPKTVMRADNLTEFKDGRLMDSGEMIVRQDLVGKVLAFDIIPEDKKVDFSGILALSDKTAGHPSNNVTNSMVDQLHRWGINEI